MWSTRGATFPQNSANPAVQDLLSHIDRDWTTSCLPLGRGHDRLASTFVSQAAIRNYFATSPQIRDIVEATCGTESRRNANSISENCPLGFCILLRLGKGGYIEHFLGHEELWDSNLPFYARPYDFPSLPQEPDFFETFYQEQWRFFPVTIPRSRAVKFRKERPLPIVDSELLKDGDTANLYRVKIHREYDKRDSNDEHKDYALKTYIGRRADTYYRTEVENFAKLCLFHMEPSEGLIRFHCGFEHNGTFNLLMDFASFGTLRDLFENEEPPSSGQDIVRFWERFSLCIQALTRIHELDLSEDEDDGSKVFQGWHQDIRPENILIHRLNDDDCSHDFRYMLGDLGLSHFVRMCRSKDDPSALDTGGTRTYGAPEIYRHSDFDATRRITATRAIDIWSLGCVMLDLCVWIVRGKKYLEAFALRREKANEDLGTRAGDCFHDGKQPHSGLSSVVEQEMSTLLDDLRISDCITEAVLNIIRRMLRPDPTARPRSPEVLADIETAIQDAKIQNNAWYMRRRSRSISASQGAQGEFLSLRSPMSPSTNPSNRLQFRGMEVIQEHEDTPFPDAEYSNGTARTIKEFNQTSLPDTRPGAHTYQTAPVILTPTLGRIVREEGGDIEKRPHSASAPGRQPLYDTSLLTVNRPTSPASPHSSPTTDQNEPRGSFDRERRRKNRQNMPYLSRDDAIKWKAARKKTHVLGQKPPIDFDHYRKWLNQRDHVFLIDDSRTMDPYKEHVTTLLSPLIYTVKEHDPDGVEVHFTVSRSNQQSKKSSVLIKEVEYHKFEGKTDISARLGMLLRKYRVTLEDKRMAHQSVRPLSIYILTDGVWEAGQDAQTPIRELIAVLKQYNFDRKQVGIQFISFGNDERGLRRLEELDQFGKQPDVGLDIVDTETSLGNVWKMLLGAIDKTFDDEFSDGEAA